MADLNTHAEALKSIFKKITNHVCNNTIHYENVYKEKSIYNFDKIPTYTNNIMLYGYFQNYRYFQENYKNSQVVVFDCFRSGSTFPNGNLKSFGHYKNLIGFRGEIISGNINNRDDLDLLNKYSQAF